MEAVRVKRVVRATVAAAILHLRCFLFLLLPALRMRLRLRCPPAYRCGWMARIRLQNMGRASRSCCF